ncbi:UMP-CMP kinase family protein [Ochromonadaceae sp. CCMP2298]|nr:UMP-CMP kinase family protein [Ochromonadaceae sp. CCMP2298]
MKPNVIFVLGGPGAGKGTQCEKLTSEYNLIQHLSAGELLRAERAKPSENGQLIDTYLREGRIVPVQISLDLLRLAMEASDCSTFLIDGFPRNLDNLQGWESKMADVCTVNSVVFIECNEEELVRRIVLRGESSGRSDDNVETMRKRLRTFKEETMPVIDVFERKAGVSLLRIDGSKDVDRVNSSIKGALGTDAGMYSSRS